MFSNKLIEKLARALCRAENVPEEHPCYGLSDKVAHLIPPGETWPAWKVRVKWVTAVLEEFDNSVTVNDLVLILHRLDVTGLESHGAVYPILVKEVNNGD